MPDDGTMPPSPLTDLAASATQQHELFMSWVNAGFTRAEAMQLLLAAFTTMILRGQAPGNG